MKGCVILLKNKKTILLAAMTLPFFTAPAAQAATQNQQLDACPSLAGLTTAPVKHVGYRTNGEQVFLDKNGNRVIPCKSDNGLQFFIVSNFKNGQQIYDRVRSQEMNRSFYDNAIDVNLGHSVISFGDKHENITDMYEFQRKYQTQKITDGTAPILPASIKDDVTKYLVIDPVWLEALPEKYKSLTPGEKQALLKTHYKQIEEHSQKIAPDTSDFQKASINENRNIKPTTSVINQFTLDKAVLEKTGDDGSPVFSAQGQISNSYGEIEGGLYLRYEASISGTKFKQVIPAFILDQLTSNKYTTDQKLSLAYTVASAPDKFDAIAEKYKADKVSFINEHKNDQQELNEAGMNDYQKLSLDEKIAYNSLIVAINNGIVDKEYTKLPQSISKKQYKSLSDIDRYKYSPVREGNFVKKDSFQKNDLDLISKYHI